MNKKQDIINIYGFEKPKVIIQEGRNFLIVKESKNKKDTDNLGVVINDKKENDINELKITNNIDCKIKNNKFGGDLFYNKYLKYKNKYLKLKNKLKLF